MAETKMEFQNFYVAMEIYVYKKKIHMSIHLVYWRLLSFGDFVYGESKVKGGWKNRYTEYETEE